MLSQKLYSFCDGGNRSIPALPILRRFGHCCRKLADPHETESKINLFTRGGIDQAKGQSKSLGRVHKRTRIAGLSPMRTGRGCNLRRPAHHLHVVGGEIRDVALRATEMPAQFVEVAPLRILLTFANALMFFERDRSPRFISNRWPETSWKCRMHEPAHSETKVMEFSQMDAGADRARLEASEQVLRSCLENHEMPDQVERFLPGRTRQRT